MLATTGIYHRLLTHKSRLQPQFYGLEASWLLQPGRWGPSWWKAHHVAIIINARPGKILIPLYAFQGIRILVVSSWMAILHSFSLEASH